MAGNRWFGNSIYPETAVYVGVIALCLVRAWPWAPAGAGPRSPPWPSPLWPWRSISYASPVVSAINQVTGLRSVAWHRAVQPMVLALAVLAGIGMDALVRSHTAAPRPAVGRRGLRRCRGASWRCCGWSGRGRSRRSKPASGPAASSGPPSRSCVGLAVVGALVVSRAPSARRAEHAGGVAADRGRAVVAGLVLLAVRDGLPRGRRCARWCRRARTSPRPRPAETALRQAVGPSLVAFGLA